MHTGLRILENPCRSLKVQASKNLKDLWGLQPEQEYHNIGWPTNSYEANLGRAGYLRTDE